MPEFVSQGVDIVQVGENHIVVAAVQSISQRIGLPLAVNIPARQQQFFYVFFLRCADARIGRHGTDIVKDFIMQFFGVPDHGIIKVKGIAQPDANPGAIFGQFQNPQAAVGGDGFVVFENLIAIIGGIDIVFHHQERLFVFLGFVDGHAVIDAFCIGQNQARPPHETAGSQEDKFFGIRWRIQPSLRRFDGRIDHIDIGAAQEIDFCLGMAHSQKVGFFAAASDEFAGVGAA